nr:MAG TPA: hypothetical protein [Caudoviricetes sp.]
MRRVPLKIQCFGWFYHHLTTALQITIVGLKLTLHRVYTSRLSRPKL